MIDVFEGFSLKGQEVEVKTSAIHQNEVVEGNIKFLTGQLASDSLIELLIKKGICLFDEKTTSALDQNLKSIYKNLENEAKEGKIGSWNYEATQPSSEEVQKNEL